jgi:hypothetical protein
MNPRLKFGLILAGVFVLGLVTGLWLWRGTAILMDFSFVGCM